MRFTVTFGRAAPLSEGRNTVTRGWFGTNEYVPFTRNHWTPLPQKTLAPRLYHEASRILLGMMGLPAADTLHPDHQAGASSVVITAT